MAATVLPPPPPPPQSPIPANTNLHAAIDMGTNSFKMLVVRADPSTGKFISLHRLNEPVLLGQSSSCSSSTLTTTTAIMTASISTSQPSISPQSELRAISALQNFTQFLQSRRIPRCRVVATSAVREAANQVEFLHRVRENLGIDIEVLSGEEEGKYVYLGILQFLPYHNKLALCIDIGGGSTELVLGQYGNVKFATSLKLGHVTLTEEFVKNGGISRMREHIRKVIKESRVLEEVKNSGFEVVVGSSGTIRAIEKAVFYGYARGIVVDDDSGGMCLGGIRQDWGFGGIRQDWGFSKEELRDVVERLCGEEGRFRRDGFFKRRSEFIVAGAVLLEEIFEVLGIEGMEVSGFALGEGVIAEGLAKVCEVYDLNANARWRSVVWVATRFNSKKRVRSAAQCACIAKEIFEGLKKCNELVDNQKKLAVSFDEKDLEYLEAACLLHSIGHFTGKKGYHKQSYHIIMNGGHLHGYSAEEVKLIATLARRHRKKFPKFDHASLKEFPEEVKHKFRILCVIIRISVIVQQYQSENFEGLEFSHSPEGYKLVLGEIKDQSTNIVDVLREGFETELKKELEHFKMVCQQNLSVVVPSRSSQSSER